jgi:hypothetical protein
MLEKFSRYLAAEDSCFFLKKWVYGEIISSETTDKMKVGGPLKSD